MTVTTSLLRFKGTRRRWCTSTVSIFFNKFLIESISSVGQLVGRASIILQPAAPAAVVDEQTVGPDGALSLTSLEGYVRVTLDVMAITQAVSTSITAYRKNWRFA